jgi:Protein of unknown function (DUF3253)
MAQASGRSLEAAILRLLDQRNKGEREEAKTICPSEVARAVAPENWRPLMQPVRDAAARLAARDAIVVTQRGAVVDAGAAKGAIRFRKA